MPGRENGCGRQYLGRACKSFTLALRACQTRICKGVNLRDEPERESVISTASTVIIAGNLDGMAAYWLAFTYLRSST